MGITPCSKKRIDRRSQYMHRESWPSSLVDFISLVKRKYVFLSFCKQSTKLKSNPFSVVGLEDVFFHFLRLATLNSRCTNNIKVIIINQTHGQLFNNTELGKTQSFRGNLYVPENSHGSMSAKSGNTIVNCNIHAKLMVLRAIMKTQSLRKITHAIFYYKCFFYNRRLSYHVIVA